jgi:hypothetical protein
MIVAMETDLASQITTLQSNRGQFSAQIAIVKKNHEMEMAAIQMVDDVARSAPPPSGQGTQVDKTA